MLLLGLSGHGDVFLGGLFHCFEGFCALDIENSHHLSCSEVWNLHVNITVGKSLGKMIRFKSKNDEPVARVHQLNLGSNGRWKEETIEAVIK